MARKRRRLSVFVVRYLPWAVLFFYTANWFWCTRGSWWLELGSVGFTRSVRYKDVVTASYVEDVRKGLYSYDGCLFFSCSLRGSPHGMPQFHGPLYNHVEVWTDGPQMGLTRSFCGREVRLIPWEPYHYLREGSISGLGFAAEWNDDKGFAVPWWFLSAMFAITPTRQCIRAWTLRKLRRRGLCPSCGYDLRATPTRCPECDRAMAPLVIAP